MLPTILSSVQPSAEVLKVYETLPDLYLVLSPQLVVLAVSDAYLAATGAVRAEVVGQSVLAVLAGSAADERHGSALLDSLQRVLATGRPDQLLVPHQIAPGRPAARYWQVVHQPVLLADGRVQYIVSKVSDAAAQNPGAADEPSTHQLVQQLQKANRLLDSISEAYVELSAAGEVTYLNRRAEQMLKVSREQLLGQNIWRTDVLRLSAEGQRIIGQAFDTHQPAEGEYVCSTVGHWVYMSATPTDEGVVVLFYDIREVKEAREKLQQEHQRLKDSQALGHIGSFETLVATGQTYWSEELYRIHGLEPQSTPLTLEQTTNFLYPEDAWAFRQLLRSLTGQQPRFRLVHRIRRHDNTVRTVETRTEIQVDAQGQVVRISGTVQDVTDVKQAERETHESITQFQALVENTPDIITRWDQNLRLLFANSAFGQRMGQPLASLLGKTNRDMQHPEAVAGPWMDKLRLVLDTGQAQDHYNSAATPTGVKYFYSRLVPEKAEDGTVQSVLAIARDITDIKRLEHEHLQLQLSQQKQLLNAVLEAQEVERRRIAESLHNGLAQVLYAAQLHLEQIQGEAEPLQAAKQQATRFLADAIQTTRAISHELIPTTLDDFGLAAAIQDVCQQQSRAGLLIHCQVEGLPRKLERYLELAVYRLVQELVNNLVQHAQATQARVVVMGDDTSIRITAQDNGRGFDAELPEGGRGLQTIHDRVKLLNGTTDIFSAPQQGTTVTIWFPLEWE